MLGSLDLGTLRIRIGVDNGDAIKELDNTGGKLSSFDAANQLLVRGIIIKGYFCKPCNGN